MRTPLMLINRTMRGSDFQRENAKFDVYLQRA
jgi:hypothetical protein